MQIALLSYPVEFLKLKKKGKEAEDPQNTIFKTHMAASDLSASEAQLVFPDREVL